MTCFSIHSAPSLARYVSKTLSLRGSKTRGNPFFFALQIDFWGSIIELTINQGMAQCLAHRTPVLPLSPLFGIVSEGKVIMELISDAELFAFFVETIEHCGLFLLDMSKEDVEWHVFEEFDAESITFLHKYALDRLLKGGYITAEVYSLCQLLYKMFRDLEETSLWNTEAVKTTLEWYEVLSLSDKIESMVKYGKYSAGDGFS